MISPSDLGIPNSRTRYMIAKHKEPFNCTPTSLPLSFDMDTCGQSSFAKELKLCALNCIVWKISDYFTNNEVDDTFFLSENILTIYHPIIDIVNPDS